MYQTWNHFQSDPWWPGGVIDLSSTFLLFSLQMVWTKMCLLFHKSMKLGTLVQLRALIVLRYGDTVKCHMVAITTMSLPTITTQCSLQPISGTKHQITQI